MEKLKKKRGIVLFICAFLLALCFSACEGCKKEYTLTFCQENATPVEITLKKGERLDESLIPALSPKTGYDVEWDRTDFSSIDGDLTIKAVYTPKNYRITYEVGEGVEISTNSQTVVFDADYALLTPRRDGYHFFGWVNGSQSVDTTGKWTIASDVVLEPVWITGYAVTFIMENGADVVIEVPEGASLEETQIPLPDLEEKTGYNVVWNRTDFSDIRENIIVQAEYAAKSYTITYRAGVGASISATTQEVRYDEEFTLLTPTMADGEFLYWKNAATGERVNGGTWTMDEDVTLVAEWYYWSPNV